MHNYLYLQINNLICSTQNLRRLHCVAQLVLNSKQQTKTWVLEILNYITSQLQNTKTNKQKELKNKKNFLGIQSENVDVQTREIIVPATFSGPLKAEMQKEAACFLSNCLAQEQLALRIQRQRLLMSSVKQDQ